MGHEALIVAPDGGVAEFEGAKIYGVPGFPFPLYPELKLAIPRPSIAKAVAAFNPDLIHALQPLLLGLAAFYCSSAQRKPLVISHHAQLARWVHYYGLGALEPLVWWGLKSGYNRSDLLLCTSTMMHCALRQHGLQRVELWQRGVDTDRFHPRFASLAMRTCLTDDHPQDKLLLFVGRLSPEKEIEQCLPILQTVPGLRLALVGDGPHRRKLERHFADTPTHFAGYLRGADLAAAFASADVFFLPSRSETLGLVLLEAMAAGCPVVAVEEGGIVDIVQDGVTGHLYKPDNLQDAIATIQRLLSDASHRETIRQQARAEAEHWGWAAATEQLVGFYRAILQEEHELLQRIAGLRTLGASMDEICGRLGISRATFRRHAREPVPQYAVR